MDSDTPATADTKLSLHVQRLPLPAGLYIVATPIGNRRDITLRALDVLASVDTILCEDTRHSQVLLQYYGITHPRRMALHDHNERSMAAMVTQWLAAGKSLALISDAGMPLIADPGYRLVRVCREQGFAVTVIPGASALTTGLALGGLPTDSFYFAGFLKKTAAERQRQCQPLAMLPATLAFYLSPHKLAASLADVHNVLGDRPAVLLRELTKKFETIYHGTMSALLQIAKNESLKGEMMLLVAGASPPEMNEETLIRHLRKAIAEHSLKAAVESVSAATGVSRRQVYQLALRLQAES